MFISLYNLRRPLERTRSFLVVLCLLITTSFISSCQSSNNQDSDALEQIDETIEMDDVITVELPDVHYYGDQSFLNAYSSPEVEMLAAGGPSEVYLKDGSWRIRSMALGIGYLGEFGKGESTNFCLFDVAVDSALNYSSGSYRKYLSWLELYKAMKTKSIQEILQSVKAEERVFIQKDLNLFSASSSSIRLSNLYLQDVFKEKMDAKFMIENHSIDSIAEIKMSIHIDEFANDSTKEVSETYDYEHIVLLDEALNKRQKLFVQMVIANDRYRPARKSFETRYYKDEKFVYYRKQGEAQWIQIDR